MAPHKLCASSSLNRVVGWLTTAPAWRDALATSLLSTHSSGGSVLRVLVWHQSNLVSHALAGVLDREEGFGVHAASGEIDRFLGVAAREAAHVAVVDHETGPLPISDTC